MSSIINCYYDYEVQKLSGNFITDNINTTACTTDEMKSSDMIDKLGGSPFIFDTGSYPILDGFNESIILPEVSLNYTHHIFSNSTITLSAVIVTPGSDTHYSYTWYKKRILPNTENSNKLQAYLTNNLSDYLQIQIGELGNYRDYTTYEVIPNETSSSITINSKTDIFSYYCAVRNLNGIVNTNIVGVCILDGQGTLSDPFQIENIHQFYSMQWLSAQNNIGGPYDNEHVYFEQTKDLYFNTIVGSKSVISLPGVILHYNGKGFHLVHLTINSGDKINCGVFEELASDSEIINLGFDNVYVAIPLLSNSTELNLGLLCGKCSNITIDNVWIINESSAYIEAPSNQTGNYHIGGLVGYIPIEATNANISNCYTTSFMCECGDNTIIGSNINVYVGGLVGYGGNFKNCYFASSQIFVSASNVESKIVNPISNNANFINCYYDSTKYGTKYPVTPTTGLVAKTTSQMQNEDILTELGESYYLISN